MKTKFHWIVGNGLPEHSAIIEAVPGVGNVGKILVDALVEKHPSRTIGWILHPDFPPHATLSNEGLLAPPRLEICLLYTSPSPRDQRGSRMPSSA